MKLTEYIKETKVELKHVSWPTRKQAMGFTMLVIVMSVVVSLYLGLFDSLFKFILEKVVLKG
mgnify:CR=1 FL=1